VAEPRSRGPAPPTAPGPEVNVIPDSTTAIVHGTAGVVDLDERRRWRLARDLGLEPTIQAPCEGVCTCWGGVPLGGRSA